MNISKDLAIRILKCIGNFVWLKNNLKNYYTQDFRNLLEDAFEEAREVYSILSELVD